jgi:hypothetical protein
VPLTAAGENALVSGGLGNAVGALTAHTGNPGTTGANPVAGGSPAYAPQAVAWNAASAGLRTNNGAVTFNVPGGTTVYFIGMADSASVNTFYGYSGVGASLLNGVATVVASTDIFTAPAHGLANGDRVFVMDPGGTLPAGLAEGTVYFVVSSTTNTFQLSATSGGAAVDVTADGTVNWHQTKPETFGSQGTLVVSNGGFVLDGTATGTI